MISRGLTLETHPREAFFLWGLRGLRADQPSAKKLVRKHLASLTIGTDCTCGLGTDGTVACWGMAVK